MYRKHYLFRSELPAIESIRLNPAESIWNLNVAVSQSPSRKSSSAGSNRANTRLILENARMVSLKSDELRYFLIRNSSRKDTCMQYFYSFSVLRCFQSWHSKQNVIIILLERKDRWPVTSSRYAVHSCRKESSVSMNNRIEAISICNGI